MFHLEKYQPIKIWLEYTALKNNRGHFYETLDPCVSETKKYSNNIQGVLLEIISISDIFQNVSDIDAQKFLRSIKTHATFPFILKFFPIIYGWACRGGGVKIFAKVHSYIHAQKLCKWKCLLWWRIWGWVILPWLCIQ